MHSEDFKYKLIVREADLDTFGHVNNATYLRYFEEARWEYISTHGYDLNYIKKVQKGPVILEVKMKYNRELHLREEVTITIKLVEAKKRVAILDQKIIKASGEVACEAQFVTGLFDMVTRKLITATPEWMAAINPQARKKELEP